MLQGSHGPAATEQPACQQDLDARHILPQWQEIHRPQHDNAQQAAEAAGRWHAALHYEVDTTRHHGLNFLTLISSFFSPLLNTNTTQGCQAAPSIPLISKLRPRDSRFQAFRCQCRLSTFLRRIKKPPCSSTPPLLISARHLGARSNGPESAKET